jgi:hypothetical protein
MTIDPKYVKWAEEMVEETEREKVVSIGTKARFNPAPYAFPDPATLPKRRCLLGHYYLGGAVSESVGGPGRLKSSTVLVELVGMAAGLNLLAGTPLEVGRLRVAYVNGEENQEELDLRVAAICQHYRIDPQQCVGRLWVESTRDRPIRVASFDAQKGRAIVAEKDLADLLRWAERRELDVLAVDPLISFHSVREDNNGDMDVVCKEAFGVIAGKTRSVQLVHHPRKLAAGEVNTTVDDGRGASAVLAAVRLARTFNFMTTAEASKLGISEDDRRKHVRIDNGKVSPGPLGKAFWVKIAVETLPNGEDVAVASRWVPPDPFEGVTAADVDWVRELVRSKSDYRADNRSKQWIGIPLAEHLGWDLSNLKNDQDKRKQAESRQNKAKLSRLISTWIGNGVLAEDERQDPGHKDRKIKYVILGSLKSEEGFANADDEVAEP